MANLKSVFVWSRPWSGICLASTCWRNPQSHFASSSAVAALKLSDVAAPLPLTSSLPLIQSPWSAHTLPWLSLFSPSLPPACVSHESGSAAQINASELATCQRFREVIFPNAAFLLFIFVTFCPPSEATRGEECEWLVILIGINSFSPLSASTQELNVISVNVTQGQFCFECSKCRVSKTPNYFFLLKTNVLWYDVVLSINSGHSPQARGV